MDPARTELAKSASPGPVAWRELAVLCCCWAGLVTAFYVLFLLVRNGLGG